VKKQALLYFFLLYSFVAFAETPVKKDSIPFSIKKISLDGNFKADSSLLDSSILDLHILNPVLRNEYSYTFLSKLGYPLESNNLASRIKYQDIFFPGISFYPLVKDIRDNSFYETNGQYTSLTYKSAGFVKSNQEQYLGVFHTQNLSKSVNIGIDYDLYSCFSKDNQQQATDHSLELFYRYSGLNYFNYSKFYFNSFEVSETGGIVSDTLVNYKTGTYDALLTELDNSKAVSKYKKLGFNSINEIKIRKLFVNEEDTTERANRDYGSVYYNLNLETNKRIYTDLLDTSYYKNFYKSVGNTNDSIVLSKISNRILLNSPEMFKYLPNLRFSLNNDLYFYKYDSIRKSNIQNYSSPYFNSEITASTDNTKRIFSPVTSYYSTSFTANINQKFNKFWLGFDWTSYFLGYNLGDQNLHLVTKMFVDSAKKYSLTLKFTSDIQTPSFLYNNYFSNHNKWDTKLNIKETKTVFSGIISMGKPQISLTADYILLNNFIYFNSNLVPVQFPDAINILAFGINSTNYLWKIYSKNCITYQLFDENSIINAPSIIYYNSTNFHHTFHFFTGGSVYFKFGVDLYYTSKYSPDAYSPSLGVFYTPRYPQNTNLNIGETGDHLKVDLHLTFKVKTLSFFLKYSHVNAAYSNTLRQFDAQHYPSQPAVFSYGLYWLFYD
jgi:hypothetical protein